MPTMVMMALLLLLTSAQHHYAPCVTNEDCGDAIANSFCWDGICVGYANEGEFCSSFFKLLCLPGLQCVQSESDNVQDSIIFSLPSSKMPVVWDQLAPLHLKQQRLPLQRFLRHGPQLWHRRQIQAHPNHINFHCYRRQIQAHPDHINFRSHFNTID